METKRLFIGLGFSEKFASSIEPWVKKIKKSADQKEIDIKWTPSRNFHVTLVFLGDTILDAIPTIEEKMQAVAKNHAPFKLKIRDISGFPTIAQARVIYLGVQRSQAILNLQSELENELINPDSVEHDYSPHLTIARLRNPKSCRDLLSPFEHIDLGKQDVSSIGLYTSTLSNGFPIYDRIFEAQLTGNKLEQADTKI